MSVIAVDTRVAGLRARREQRADAPRIADVSVAGSRWVLTGAAVIATLVLLWATGSFQPNADDWLFIYPQPLDPGGYFLPHNGVHWATVPYLVYAALMNVFTLHSHLPFQGALMFQHLLTVFLLFRVVRRRCGEALALAAALIVLVLGWGAVAIVWCCPGSDSLAVALGLLAIDLLDSGQAWSWRVPAAGVALLLSVASSAFGLAFVVAVVVQVLLEPGRLTRLVAALVPGFAYLGWYVAARDGQAVPELAGISAIATNLPAPSPVLLGRYVLHGLGAAGVAAAGLAGDPMHEGWQILASLLVLAAVVVVGSWRRLDGRVLGALAGLVALNAVTGFARVQEFGVDQAGASRYMYPAVVLLLLLVTPVVARVRWGVVFGTVMAALVLVSMIGNAIAFHDVLLQLNRNSEVAATEVRTINAVRSAPDLDPHATIYWDGLVVGNLLVTEQRYGNPTTFETLAELRASHSPWVDGTLRTVLRPGLRLTPVDAEGCRASRPVRAAIASGDTRLIRVVGDGWLNVALGWATAPARAARFAVHTGFWLLRVPDAGSPQVVWRVAAASSTARVSMC